LSLWTGDAYGVVVVAIPGEIDCRREVSLTLDSQSRRAENQV